MAAIQGVSNNSTGAEGSSRSTELRRAGLIGSIFGCWHRNMSRPLTRNGETYRACLNCGARRQFNLSTWRLNGPYYYGPSSAEELAHAQTQTVQPKRRPWLVRNVA